MAKKRILEEWILENQHAPSADTMPESIIRKDNRSVEQLAMDNCKVLGNAVAERVEIHTCKTCKKEFSSFQALGGHRTSHKQRLPRIAVTTSMAGEKGKKVLAVRATSSRSGKMHKCSICGREFSLGQALGGHMRRHRLGGREVAAVVVGGDSGTRSECSSETSSSNRVTWDLNLTPDENGFIYG